jgi:nucleoside-diphosphate-sugar epimerase
MPSNLIIGCGYLGRRVADLWLKQEKSVFALTRSHANELSSLGIEPIVGDICQPASLRFPKVQTVLYAVSIDRSSGKTFHDVYVKGLQNVLTKLPKPKQFLYVSSTSVYAQSDGSWVNENSVTQPVESNGKVILEAEELLRSHIPESIILRFSGIYGPDRVIRRASIERGEPLLGDGDKWINLIHVDDGAQAILAANESGIPGETYLINDDEPVTRRDFYTYMAELLGAPSAKFETISPDATMPASEWSNRRMSNQKMHEKLKIKLTYPNYKIGLQQAVKE